MSVTEIVGVFCAENFMPANKHVQRVTKDGATRWNRSLFLDMDRNHGHREVLPTNRATVIKPRHRHHITDVFSFDGTCRKDEPFQVGGALLVKPNRMKDLGTYRTEPQSLNTTRNLSVDESGD